MRINNAAGAVLLLASFARSTLALPSSSAAAVLLASMKPKSSVRSAAHSLLRLSCLLSALGIAILSWAVLDNSGTSEHDAAGQTSSRARGQRLTLFPPFYSRQNLGKKRMRK